MICEPIFKKLRKEEHTFWDEGCQKAFDQIKQILSNPPVLVPPQKDLPLSLYLTTTDTAMGAMLAQTVDKEIPGLRTQIYALGKKLSSLGLGYEEAPILHVSPPS